MIVQKCDICGKVEGTKILDINGKKNVVRFSKVPLKMTVKNVVGEEYDICLFVINQKTSDTKKIDKALNSVSNENIREMLAKNENGDTATANFVTSITFDNPNPSICDECRKIMISKFCNESK